MAELQSGPRPSVSARPQSARLAPATSAGRAPSARLSASSSRVPTLGRAPAVFSAKADTPFSFSTEPAVPADPAQAAMKAETEPSLSPVTDADRPVAGVRAAVSAKVSRAATQSGSTQIVAAVRARAEAAVPGGKSSAARPAVKAPGYRTTRVMRALPSTDAATASRHATRITRSVRAAKPKPGFFSWLRSIFG